jgi:purine-binding chemotaxis protein CheW
MRLDPAQIRAVPDIGGAIDKQFITGIGTIEDRMLILLDIERLMGSAEMGLVAQAA